MINKRSISDNAIDIILYIFLTMAGIATLYPLINIVAVSLSEYSGYVSNPLMVIPTRFTLEGWKVVFRYPHLGSSYLNTIFVTVVGTVIGVCLTSLTAYPLSKKGFAGKSIFMGLIIFTMFFGGGMIPNFFLIKSLGLLDTLWALILPGSIAAFNVILMISFFNSLPESLEEAAKIDGASYPYVFFKIVLPLSKPILATIALFKAVGYWNSYFNAVIYIRSASKWTLQLVLREIIYNGSSTFQTLTNNDAEVGKLVINPINLQYAALVAAIIPILCVYPFVQKYFVKGVMIGAVKG